MHFSLPHSLLALNFLICLTLSSPSTILLPRDLVPKVVNLPPITARNQSPNLSRRFLDFVARGVTRSISSSSSSTARAGAGGVGHTTPERPDIPETDIADVPDTDTPNVPDSDTPDTSRISNSDTNNQNGTTSSSSLPLPTATTPSPSPSPNPS